MSTYLKTKPVFMFSTSRIMLLSKSLALWIGPIWDSSADLRILRVPLSALSSSFHNWYIRTMPSCVATAIFC